MSDMIDMHQKRNNFLFVMDEAGIDRVDSEYLLELCKEQAANQTRHTSAEFLRRCYAALQLKAFNGGTIEELEDLIETI